MHIRASNFLPKHMLYQQHNCITEYKIRFLPTEGSKFISSDRSSTEKIRITVGTVKFEPSSDSVLKKNKIMSSKKIVRKIITSSLSPRPVGPYNQAVLADRTLYLSGVLGIDVKTEKLVEGGAAAEARQALINMGHILKEANSDYNKVIKTTILLQNINDFADVNNIYKEFFQENCPARSTFQVGKLPLGALFEIEAIALTGEVETI